MTCKHHSVIGLFATAVYASISIRYLCMYMQKHQTPLMSWLIRFDFSAYFVMTFPVFIHDKRDVDFDDTDTKLSSEKTLSFWVANIILIFFPPFVILGTGNRGCILGCITQCGLLWSFCCWQYSHTIQSIWASSDRLESTTS